MRIQFLVAAHKDPELVVRLCERLLDTPDSAVTVQWDRASTTPSLPPELAVDFRITRAPCEWGSGAQLDAMLDSLRSVAAEPFDWLVLLSGQDYPVRPLGELSEFLAGTSHRLFLESDDVPGSAYLHERYFYRYHWVPQRWWKKLTYRTRRVLGAALQHAVRVLSPRGTVRVQRRPRNVFSPGVGVRTRASPFTAERPCRKGSDWFAISREVFDDLLDQVAASPELIEHLRHCYCPNESFFHTVLLPRWEAANAGHNLHYLRFVGNGAHPEILRAADWDTLIGTGAFFGKLDERDTALLDRIDHELLT